MARRRKAKPVSLACAQALKTVPTHMLGDSAPTPERLMQAGVSVAMQLGTRRVQVVGGNSPLGVDGVVRLAQAPLDRLFARGRLDERDDEHNRQLFEAGDKLRNHHYLAGLSGLAANDINGAGGSHPASRTPISETMESSRRVLRIAGSAMNAGDWAVVRDVVCDEASLGEAGRRVGYGNDEAAAAVALDRLRRGLSELAALWGFSPPDRARPATKPLAQANDGGRASAAA